MLRCSCDSGIPCPARRSSSLPLTPSSATRRWISPRSPPRNRAEARPPAASFPLSANALRIGRDPESDVVVDDVLVSRRHAEIRRLGDGRYEAVDLESHNGTFVNGRRIKRVVLDELDVVGVGRNSYRLVDGRLDEYVDTGEVAYAAVDLTVRLANGAVLLDDVSFSLGSRSMLGVIGPSGSGKSTLLGALTGFRMANEGDVRYGDRSLYADYDALRQRIGYVPQDDIVHPELTVERELDFAADIRFPSDVGPAERDRRLQEVTRELALAHRRDTAVARLSGGERKRVSVGLELLTAPSLLFLDEPTSGLDPNYERSLMELFRDLANRGRTVVVVTHSVQSLRLCDRVLALAPGGRVAYFGPPQLMLAYFDRDDYADVFHDLGQTDGAASAARFRAHPYYATLRRAHRAGGPAHTAHAAARATGEHARPLAPVRGAQSPLRGRDRCRSAQPGAPARPGAVARVALARGIAERAAGVVAAVAAAVGVTGEPRVARRRARRQLARNVECGQGDRQGAAGIPPGAGCRGLVDLLPRARRRSCSERSRSSRRSCWWRWH